MPSVNQTLVRRFFDETCNQGKLEVADENFFPDHKYHDPSNPLIVPGPEGMKAVDFYVSTSLHGRSLGD
jgi:hypothetical protein